MPLLLAALLAVGPGLAAELPPEVAAFVARRDHLRGEASDDPARAAQIARQLEAKCWGTDAELARLKRRHQGEPAIRARLGQYNPRVH